MLGVLITITRVVNERAREEQKRPLSAADNGKHGAARYCRIVPFV